MPTPRRTNPDHPGYIPESRDDERYAGTYQRWLGRLALPWIAYIVAVPLLMRIASNEHYWWSVRYATLAGLATTAAWIAALFFYRASIQRTLLNTYHPPCPGCGYDIADNDACPECGLTLCIEDRKQAWRDAGYQLR